MTEEKLIGKVTHFYDHIGVAIIELSDTLSVGQTVRFSGAHEDYTQTVVQIQLEHKDIEQALPGQSVGIRVGQKIHVNDKVYLQQ